MKNLFKYMVVVVILAIGGMVMTGCEEDMARVTQNVADETKTEESAHKDASEKVKDRGEENKSEPKDKKEKNDIKEEKDKKEDTIKLINSRVDELAQKSDEGTKAIDANKSKIEDIEKRIKRSNIIIWSFIAITFIVAVVSLFKANAVNGRAERHREEIEKIKQYLSEIGVELKRMQSKVDGISYGVSHMEDFSGRINAIDRRMDELSKQKPHQQAVPATPPRQREQNGFFGLPSKMSETEAYFKKLIDSRDNEVRFSVVVRGNKAEFKILEGDQYLNDLKSNDAIKMAIETIGCSLSEARRMTTSVQGGAEKIDGRWMITKKAKILLTQ